MTKTHEEITGKNSERFEKVRGFGESRINNLIEGFREARIALKEAEAEEVEALKDTVRILAQTLIKVLDYKLSLLAEAKENPEAKDWNNKTVDTAETEALIELIEKNLSIETKTSREDIERAATTLDKLGEVAADSVDSNAMNEQMAILESAKSEREQALRNLNIYGDENESRLESLKEELARLDNILNAKKDEEKPAQEGGKGKGVEDYRFETLKGNKNGHDLGSAFEKKPGKRGLEKIEYTTIGDEVTSYLNAIDNKNIKGEQGQQLKLEAAQYIAYHLTPLSKMIQRLEKSGDNEEILSTAKKDLELLNTLANKTKDKKAKAIEYNTISSEIDGFMDYLDILIGTDSPVPPEKIKEISSYLDYHKPNLEKLISKLEKNDKNSDILKLVKNDYEKLKKLYSKFWPEKKDRQRKQAEAEGKLGEYPIQSPEDEKVLKRSYFLHRAFSEAVHKYLENKNAGKKPSTKDVDALNLIFGQVRHFIKTEREKDAPTIKAKKGKKESEKNTADEQKKAKGDTSAQTIGPRNFEPFKIPDMSSVPEMPHNHGDNESTNPTENKEAEQPSTPQPLPRLPIEQIFIMKKGEAYANISEDKGFDGWMKSFYRQMVNRNEADQDNARDIEAWYQEYVESAEYRAKLIEIFSDIQKSPEKMDVEISREKIQSLEYDLYRNGDKTREKIDAIYASYKKSKADSKAAELEDKILAMKIEIGNDRQSNRNGELKPEQIKTILESRGIENTAENISEVFSFLKNMDLQYDMYMGGKKEGEADELVKAYRRYTASPETTNGKKPGWFKNAISKFIAVLPASKDYKKFNEFAILVDQVRKLNLVDRKTGNKDAAAHNKRRMEDLLNLVQNEGDLVQTYATNPESIDLSKLSVEKKDLLETFKTMYDKYTSVKYRSDEGKQRAESILQYKPGGISSISREDILSPVDVLFDTSAEKEAFKSKAKYEITKRDLSVLEKEIDGFPKKKIDNKKVKELLARFNAIEEEMKKAPEREGGDDITLSKVSIKLRGLMVRHSENKEDPIELSKSLKTYDQVLFSQVIPKEERINYANTLIASLEQQKKTKGNTLIQTAIINDTIEKYQQILKQIQ